MAGSLEESDGGRGLQRDVRPRAYRVDAGNEDLDEGKCTDDEALATFRTPEHERGADTSGPALVEQGGENPLKPGAGFPGAGRCSTSVQPIFRNDSLARWAMQQMC